MRYILCVVSISALALLLATVTVSWIDFLFYEIRSQNVNFTFSNEADDEDAKNMLKQMAADCIEKTNATDDDVNAMCNKEQPTTRTGKCLAFCMMNQFNCVSKK